MRRLSLLALALVLAGCGGSSTATQSTQSTQSSPPKPAFAVGVVEDAPKWRADAAEKAKEAGFAANVLSAVWKRGSSAATDANALRPAVGALTKQNVDPVLAVYQFSSQTPLQPADRQAFADYTAGLVKALPEVHEVIVGNEPNLNLFWMPQFDASGGDAAAAAFEQLLAGAYDAVKAAAPNVEVVGGGISPRGSDDAASSRPTHSPTAFIRDLGAAYRASGRTKPLMDAISVHVYGEQPKIPPSFVHPDSTSIGIADYPKLVQLVDAAFGPKLPIVYGEYGVETAIPPAKQHLYTGHEVVPAVDEATQAQFYKQAIDLASCQKRVQALYLFHVIDETDLAGLQSGLFYADGSPKSSLEPVRQAIEHPKCRR